MTPIAGNLPAPLTSFVGRRRDVAEVRRLLRTARLVTLTGTGGVGKTRLALHVAGLCAAAYPDGVWLVDLAPVRDPSTVAATALGALRLPDLGTRPALDALIGQLARHRALVVLDNCEHLPDASADLVTALLAACPGLGVLATGRRALAVPGEHVHALAPLPADGEAVELLQDRAAAVRPDFRVTDANRDRAVRLCAELDGLPLAIELAAARLRSLTLDVAVERLTDRFALLTGGCRTAPPRQHSLRGMVEWSYELCAPAERLLWNRLSVFRDGFGADAAADVCSGDGITAAEVPALLDRLVAQSVVVVRDGDGPPRHHLPEILREYGHARLTEPDRQRLARRHRDFYLALAERLAQRWYGPGQPQALARLRAEHANLRLALDHRDGLAGADADARGLAGTDADARGLAGTDADARDLAGTDVDARGLAGADVDARGLAGTDVDARGLAGTDADARGLAGTDADAHDLAGTDADAQAELALAAALRFHWSACGLLAEGRRRLDRALDAAPAPTLPRARALSAAAWLALLQGDPEAARRRLDEAERLGHRLASPSVLASVQGLRGTSALLRNESARALTHFEEALAAHQDAGESAQPLFWLFQMTLAQSRLADPRALDTGRRAVALAEAHGERHCRSYALLALGYELRARGDHDQALAHIRAALEILRDFDDFVATARALDLLAWIAAARGAHARAGLLLGAVSALARGVSIAPGAESGAHHARCAQAVASALGPQARDKALAEGSRYDTPAQAIALALDEDDDTAVKPLTRRERDVAALVAQGLTNRRIATRLSLSPRTVDRHVENILTKLGLRRRAQLAAWWAERREPAV
ncbi:LuxR C-terminal-related transcriptional regulator [Streptomyces roseirectus]|uniref:LuxR C-terminal-related transcriptional regulator n=1 Tax=Streptomyces roseirectus TaxID=2768066 RepID=UPI001FEBBB7E|nr:LuxR C-terminal-related transcriptional regulator [Streptomyces roseirectus]